VSRAWSAWDRFWFRPQSLATLVLFRVAFGTLVFVWALSALADAPALFGSSGVLPDRPGAAGSWSVFDLWNADAAAVIVLALLAVAALAVVAGALTRIASIVVFACFVSLSARNPYIGNSGDALLRTLSLYLALAPAGAALSLDRLRRRRDGFWDIPLGVPWALRLIQVQISVLYASTVWAKLRGDLWPDGTAVGYALRLDDLTRFAMPDIGQSSLVIHVLTFAVLATEFSLGVLVWNRRLRPWVLLAGVCLHLGIEYRLRVGFFSWAILTSYVAFIPPEVAERLIHRVSARLPFGAWRESASTP
jgi:hypothetical protein